MIILTIYNARTFCEGSESQIEILKEALRVPNKSKGLEWRIRARIKNAARWGKFKGLSKQEVKEAKEKIREDAKWFTFYDNRTNSFGSGLVGKVLKYLKKEGVKTKVEDFRTKLEISSKGIKKLRLDVEYREYQVEALKQALEKQRGILHLTTNSGKTEVAIGLVAELQHQLKRPIRVLYLVHMLALAKQPVTRFKNHGFEAIMIGGGKKEVLETGIVAATVQTATNLLKKSAFKRFLSKCDLVFVDELHVNKGYQATKVLNFCNAPMRIGLSGSIDKEKPIYYHYRGLTGPIIAEVTNKQLVDLGKSAKPIMRMVEVNSKLVSGDYRTAYVPGIVENKTRNQLIVKEATRYLEKDLKVLILVVRRKHGILLQKKFESIMDIPCQFVSGKDPLFVREKAVKRFTNGKLPLLIASNIFQIGMDIPAIEAGVLAGGGVGFELVKQRLGRFLREKKGDNRVFLTDFVDKFNPNLFAHSIKRLKFYKAENIAKIKIVGGKVLKKVN